MTDVRALLDSYLTEAKLMQLATVSKGRPWACSVWFAADSDLNLYWFSAETRRHSADVLSSPYVAAAIALPHTPSDPPRGVSVEGQARLLTDEAEIQRARSSYEGRIFPADRVEAFMNHAERPHRFYLLAPTRYVLFDAVNFPDNPRQEYVPSSG